MGMEPPESCIPPDAPPHLQVYLDHFWKLSSCRGVVAPGYPGPIPWVHIYQYACHLGIQDDDVLFADLVCIIDSMDNVYLENCREVAKRNGNSPVVSG